MLVAVFAGLPAAELPIARSAGISGRSLGRSHRPNRAGQLGKLLLYVSLVRTGNRNVKLIAQP